MKLALALRPSEGARSGIYYSIYKTNGLTFLISVHDEEPVACMLGSSNRQENGEWRVPALHVEQKGEVAGAATRESEFFDLQSRKPEAADVRCCPFAKLD